MHGWILADLECETKPPVCCGNTMTLVEEKPADLGKEKHMPVNTPANGVYDVTGGEVPHPMLEKYFILFIALATSKEVYRKFFIAG